MILIPLYSRKEVVNVACKLKKINYFGKCFFFTSRSIILDEDKIWKEH